MVEQFEERVEASVDELRQQLAAAVTEVGGCRERLAAVEGAALPPLGAEELLALRERTEGLERRLETAQAGASGTSAAAAEAAAQAAAAMEAAQAVRAEVHSAVGVLQQQLDPAETLAAAKKVASVSSSVADLEAAAALTKASLRALEEQAHGLRASNTEVQQRLSALNQRSTTLEQSIQTASAAASAELGDATAALQGRCAELQAAQQATAARGEAIGERTAALETLVGVVEANHNEAVHAVASVRTAITTEASALAAGISKAEHAAASLGSRLALAEQRVNELQASKQDAVTAVTMDMVNARVANGVEESSMRAAEAALRVQEVQGAVADLQRLKADRADTVTTTQLQMRTQDILEDASKAVQAVAEDVQRRIERKAEAADVHGLEAEAAKRFAGLEAALLKGLHAVSAKTAAGLDVKVACEEYNRFRGSITARLNDVARALTELLPTARAADSSRGRAATTCLSCDQRVRSNSGVLRALAGAGATPDSMPLLEHLQRAAAPVMLPAPPPVPHRKAISSADPIGAYHNARLALKSRQHASLQVHQKRQGPPVLAARPHTVGVLRPTGAGFRDDETLAGRTSPAER